MSDTEQKLLEQMREENDQLNIALKAVQEERRQLKAELQRCKRITELRDVEISILEEQNSDSVRRLEWNNGRRETTEQRAERAEARAKYAEVRLAEAQTTIEKHCQAGECYLNTIDSLRAQVAALKSSPVTDDGENGEATSGPSDHATDGSHVL